MAINSQTNGIKNKKENNNTKNYTNNKLYLINFLDNTIKFINNFLDITKNIEVRFYNLLVIGSFNYQNRGSDTDAYKNYANAVWRYR